MHVLFDAVYEMTGKPPTSWCSARQAKVKSRTDARPNSHQLFTWSLEQTNQIARKPDLFTVHVIGMNNWATSDEFSRRPKTVHSLRSPFLLGYLVFSSVSACGFMSCNVKLHVLVLVAKTSASFLASGKAPNIILGITCRRVRRQWFRAQIMITLVLRSVWFCQLGDDRFAQNWIALLNLCQPCYDFCQLCYDLIYWSVYQTHYGLIWGSTDGTWTKTSLPDCLGPV